MRTKLVILAFVSILSFVLMNSCSNNNSSSDIESSSNQNNTGKSGSIARFAIADNYLYTVDSQSLRLFDISDSKVKFLIEINIGFNIETIFARKNNLFIASSNGVYIYDITDKHTPKFLSLYEHIYSCDPVVTDDNYAYATLNTSAERCWNGVNELDIIDISDLSNPKGIYNQMMENPQGLGLYNDNRLVLCNNGIELYDITNRKNIKILYSVKESANDVIINGNLVTGVTNSGITNYEINNDTLYQLGKLKYNK